MKKLLIIAALFIVFSATGFSQTTDGSTGTIDLVVTDKIIVDSTQYVYKLTDVNTGSDYVSLPTGEQLAIGEHVPVSDGQYNSFKVILGGIKTSSEGFRENHPDFLWMPFK